jgi:hypothetical protein
LPETILNAFEHNKYNLISGADLVVYDENGSLANSFIESYDLD